MFVVVDELAPEPVDKAQPRLRYRYGEARSVWLASTGEDRRVCTECRIEYPLEDFHRIHRDRRVTICRLCRLEKQSAYRAGLSADRQARNRLGMAGWRFGLTPEAVEQILIQQGNRCAICDRMMTTGRGVEGANLDHKRGTRQPRGFLCKECNIKVGHFEHVQRFTAEFVARMTAYLRRHEKQMGP